MNVKTLRRVDSWIGIPVCAVLTLVRKLAAPFARRPAGRVERILFIKLAEQGSTVLAYPALRRAVDELGAENVYFVAFAPNRFILDAMEIIPPENVIPIRTGGALGTLVSTLSTILALRRMRIDATVDLEFFARSTAILGCLTGAKRRVGLHAFAGDGPWRGDLMTHRLVYNPHLHTAQTFDTAVQALGQPAGRFPAFDVVPAPLDELPRPRIEPRAEELAEVEELIRAVTGRGEAPPLVLLNANCSDLMPLRKWDDANYVELARRLLDRHPALFIGFTGAPDEAPAVQALVDRIGSDRCVSFAGRTSMRQLLILYELAEVLVTNDSGPAHFASATSVDVVVFFGPETPKLFHGLSSRNHVVWARTACSPCVSAYNNRVSKCTDNVCMKRIGVDEVFESVCALLAAPRRAGDVPASPEQDVEIPHPAAARWASSPAKRARTP